MKALKNIVKFIDKKFDKKNVKNIVLFFINIVILTLVIKSLFFYYGIYFAPKRGIHDLNISIVSTTPEFTDAFEKTKGSVLFDLAHDNNFSEEEIDLLIFRITERGNKVSFLTDIDDLDIKLRQANSFVVILPKESYSEKELNLLKEFTTKNGKLLLISDPDRENKINSVANKFGIIFFKDYLYNQKENDGNFKFILLKDFKLNDITNRFKKIALYTACPIIPSDSGIVFTDKNTFSSSDNDKTDFAPIVLKDSVLAICDITFFDQPYNKVLSNNQLISNIANYLTNPEKKFNLADFPYFFEENVTIVTTNPDLSKHAIILKNKLSEFAINANLSRILNKNMDSIDIRLLDDFKATQIRNLVVDEDSFRINDLLFSRKGYSLIHLAKNNATLLTILADNDEVLTKTLEILDKEELRTSLINDNLAVITGSDSKEGEEE